MAWRARAASSAASNLRMSPSGGAKPITMSSGRTKASQPKSEFSGKIERRKSALAHDHGMHEFDRDVLRIGGAGAAPEGKQAAAAQEALRHFLRNSGQPGRFARKEIFEDAIAPEQPFGNVLCECGLRRSHTQQMRGSGSPTSMSITRVPP